MKRNNIENHSRAAFYLKSRGRWTIPAHRAWAGAISACDTYQERHAANESAHTALALLWESLGKVEPKKYGPDGVALQAARDLSRQESRLLNHATAYRGHAPESPYVGTWQPGKPGLFYCENPDSIFRNVTPVDSIFIGHSGGYYDNPHGESSRDGSGLVWGVVAQLPGKGGKARFVAGYRYGSTDGNGATFDLGDIFTAEGEEHESAQRDAAYTADSMAQHAAETEQEYQAAWGAGSLWADLGEQVKTARTNCLAILAERKAFKGTQAPALCRAITDSVTAWRKDIAEARQERAALASGGQEPFWFYWTERDTTQLAGFAEGAGLTLAEARAVCS